MTVTPTGAGELARKLRAINDVMIEHKVLRQSADALEAAERVIAFYADKEKYAVRMMAVGNCEPEVMDDHGSRARDYLARHATSQRKGGTMSELDMIRGAYFECDSCSEAPLPEERQVHRAENLRMVGGELWCEDCFDGSGAFHDDWREIPVFDPVAAIERGKAEERAHGLQALRLAHEMQDKAVAVLKSDLERAERERDHAIEQLPVILRAIAGALTEGKENSDE